MKIQLTSIQENMWKSIRRVAKQNRMTITGVVERMLAFPLTKLVENGFDISIIPNKPPANHSPSPYSGGVSAAPPTYPYSTDNIPVPPATPPLDTPNPYNYGPTSPPPYTPPIPASRTPGGRTAQEVFGHVLPVTPEAPLAPHPNFTISEEYSDTEMALIYAYMRKLGIKDVHDNMTDAECDALLGLDLSVVLGIIEEEAKHDG